MQPRQYLHQLKSTGSEVVSIDVTASNRKATFRFDNVETRMGSEWLYAQKIRLYIRTQIDQPASGGSAIFWDDFYRAITSIKLACDDLGVLYGEGDINGPQLGLIAQIVSARYRAPWQIRSNLASTDGDNAIEFVLDIPIGHSVFHKGHQTGIWTGHFKNNGQLEVNFADSTWPAAVSTGAAAEATTDVRAELLYTSEPEARPPAIWTWKVRSTNANEKKHTIKDLCQGSGIKGAMGIGKVAFLAYVCDVNGLGGADGADNIQRIFPRDRGQPSFDLGSPFYAPASLLGHFISQTNHMVGASFYGTDKAYPLGLSNGSGAAPTVTGRPNIARAYMVPFFWPNADGQQVSKLQEVSGDYYIEQDYAAVPSLPAQWITLEQSYLTPAQKEFLMGARMGLPPSQFKSYVKTDRDLRSPGDARGFATQQQKLRGIPEKIRAR